MDVWSCGDMCGAFLSPIPHALLSRSLQKVLMDGNEDSNM